MSVRHESGDNPDTLQSLGLAERDREARGRACARMLDLRHPESGQTTVVMTLFLATFLFGFIALGIDVQVLFHAKRQAQAAADAAAVAAAEEAPSITNEVAAAKAVAKMNGFDTGASPNPAVVTVNQVPTSGNYTTAPPGSYLEVIVSQPIQTFFAGMVTHKTTMLIAARAVGVPVSLPTSCVCLEGTGPVPDLNLNNGARMNPNGCGTTVNSAANNAITLAGGSRLGGVSIGSVSPDWNTWNGGGNINNGARIDSGTVVVTGIPAGCSPAAPTPLPPAEFAAGKCMDDPSLSSTTPHIPWNGSTFSVGPTSAYSIAQPNNSDGTGVVCYTSLTVGANGNNETLNPGIYIINGGALHFQGNGNQGGQGVLFYLIGGAALTIDNGANVNLVAMNSGAYAGVVIFQDPVGDSTVPRLLDSSPISVQGGANMNLSGTIFAPTANVTLGNGSNSTVNASLIAKTLTINGGSTALDSMPITGLGAIVSTTAKLIE